jgi:uncharacterized protein YggU (UPF0235/DUF167 family)
MPENNCSSANILSRLIRQHNGGVYFKVYVIPRARRMKLVLENGELLLYVDEDCKHHRVNYAVLRFFNKIFGVKVRILRGWADRVKIIWVEGISAEEAARILSEHLH